MSFDEIAKALRMLRSAVAVLEEAPLQETLFPAHDVLRNAIRETHGEACLETIAGQQKRVWNSLGVYGLLGAIDLAQSAIDAAAMISSCVSDPFHKDLPERFRVVLAEYRGLLNAEPNN